MTVLPWPVWKCKGMDEDAELREGEKRGMFSAVRGSKCIGEGFAMASVEAFLRGEGIRGNGDEDAELRKGEEKGL